MSQLTRRDGDKSFSARPWQFDKRVTFGEVISAASLLLMLGGPVLYWARAIEQQNTITENRVRALEIIQEVAVKGATALALDARDQRIAILSRMDAMDQQITQLRIDLASMGSVVGAKVAGRK